jgi:tetratricopeptide (TPR) repeat protein
VKALRTEGQSDLALEYLSRLPPSLRKPLPDLKDLLRQKSSFGRVTAARRVCLLDRKLEKEAVAVLLRETTDTDSFVRSTAFTALVELADKGVDAAVAALEKAVADSSGGIPGSARAALGRRRGPLWHVKRGRARWNRDEIDGAIAAWEEAARLDPKLAVARMWLGVAFARKKAYPQALAHFDAALKLDPEDAEALNGRAEIRAKCPKAEYRDGKQAIRDARRACELADWRGPSFLETLAAAHAEAGDFAEAVRWQTKALECPLHAAENGKEARERLRGYKQRRPSRD